MPLALVLLHYFVYMFLASTNGQAGMHAVRSCSYVKEMAGKFHLGIGYPMVGQHVIVWISGPGKRFREASSRVAFHLIGALSHNITPGEAWERRSSQGVEAPPHSFLRCFHETNLSLRFKERSCFVMQVRFYVRCVSNTTSVSRNASLSLKCLC